MNVPRHLNDVLDAAERLGKLNLHTAEIAKSLPHVTAEALRQALQRQQRKGRIVRASRGSGHWILVPLQHTTVGAPPLEAWLDIYLAKTLELPYYVGLLSAAEIHGASPQAVMVTQVMVPKPRRAIEVGRHRITFMERERITKLPVVWHETTQGRFKVSGPELTMLDLVSRQRHVGGISRVYEVLQGLLVYLSAERLAAALEAVHEIPAAQRLGVLLAEADQPTLANVVGTWLRGKRIRRVSISPGNVEDTPAVLNMQFKVFVPTSLTAANS